ncbi:MAG: M43 family zinc metalloprotease [Agriterribacter sp.]
MNKTTAFRYIFLALLSFGWLTVVSQDNTTQHRGCATGTVMEKYFQNHPLEKIAFEKRQQDFQKKYDLLRKQKQGLPAQQRVNALVTIPVVVHIVMEDPSLVTDDQVQSQLDVLNADYAGLNADSVNIPAAFKARFGKSELRFCLAQRTPGNAPTTGIERFSTVTKSYPGEGDPVKYSSMGGVDAWDVNKYLNIWVCEMDNENNLGYTFMPGLGIAAAERGFVTAYHAFGTIGSAKAPFNKGRTATHEIGHFFNLSHIWGANDCTASCSDSDNVDDTPNQSKCFFDTPSYPQTDACTATAPGVMFMNYMDYVDDAAMCLFTTGQADRMSAAMNSFSELTPLLSSNGCEPPLLYDNNVEAQQLISPNNIILNCETSFTPQLLIRNIGNATLTSVNINTSVDDQAPVVKTLSLSLPSLQTATISGDVVPVSAGYHSIKVYTTQPNGLPDQFVANDTAQSIFSVTGTATAPVSEGFESGFPPQEWGISNTSDVKEYNPVKTTNAAHSGSASVKFDTYHYQLFGKSSVLNSSEVTIPVTADSLKVTFWRAAAQASSSTTDTLAIEYSTDCGQTFLPGYKKSGTDLKTTAEYVSDDYVPALTEWVADTLDLSSAIAGKFDKVMVRFRMINGYGNNVYLDDIRIYSVTLPAALKQRGYILTPNPTTGSLVLQNYNSSTPLKAIAVFSSVGQVIWKAEYENASTSNYIPINLRNVAPGIYFVKLVYGDKTVVEKILKID